MAKALLTPRAVGTAGVIPWLTVTAAAATATSAALKVPVADTYAIWVNVTTATGTSPTCDIVLQTSVDGGTTYIDLPLRYTQKTAAAAEVLVFKLGLGQNEVALAQVVADTGGQLAKNCVFDPNYLKVKYTIGGTNPSFTFKMYVMVLPSDWNS